MRSLCCRKGFSLAELLVGTAVLAVLLAAVAGVLKTGLMASKYNLSFGHIMAPARHAAEYLSNRLRTEAVSVTTPVAGGSVVQMAYTDSVGNAYTIYCDATAHSLIVTKNGAVNTTLAAGIVQGVTFLRDSETCGYSCEEACDATIPPQVGRLTVKLVVNDNAYSGSPQRTICFSVVLWNVTS